MKGMVSSVKNKFFTRKFVPAQGAKSTCKVCRCRKGMGINMKKKRISTVLFSIMCFCMLAGCADNEQEKVTDTQLEQQRGENFELEAGQEVLPGNENEEEQNQMQQTVQAPPQIAFETVNKNWWNADKSAVVVNANYQRITVEGEGYEALATSLGGFSSTQEEDLIRFAENAVAAVEKNSEMDTYYYLFTRYSGTRVDENVVSILEKTNYTNGSVQNGNACYGYTYDAKTGTILSWEEIVNNVDGFKKAATDTICAELQLEYGAQLKPDYQTTVAGMWEKLGSSKWYLDASGITFIFQKDEITDETAFATVSFNQLAEFIKPEYQLNSNAYVAKLPTNGMFVYDGMDQASHSLTLNRSVISEYMDNRYEIRLNGNVQEVGEYIYLEDAYLIREESGKIFLIITMNMASDDYVTTVYDISNGELVQTDKQSNMYFDSTPINAQQIKMAVNVDVLGSYATQMDYYLDEAGKLVPQSKAFQVVNSYENAFYMTTTKELPVVIGGEETTLPVGTRLCIVATDNQGIAYFRIEGTKQEGEIHYTTSEEEWGCSIQGIRDMEYFDMVPYAG